MHGIGLRTSGALHSQKHLIPQVHFRRAYQGIHSAVFPSDARRNCAISASISNSISQAAQRF